MPLYHSQHSVIFYKLYRIVKIVQLIGLSCYIISFCLVSACLHYIHRLDHHHVSTCTHVNKFQKMTRAKHG